MLRHRSDTQFPDTGHASSLRSLDSGLRRSDGAWADVVYSFKVIGVIRTLSKGFTGKTCFTILPCMEPLSATPNPFGGIVLEPDLLPSDPLEFAPRLKSSLEEWTAEGYKLVWLELPLSRSSLVPVAAGEGFTYHHADDRYVMMLKRLEDEAFVPNYSTHYIGAGGVVINADNEILVVREKRGGVGSGSFKLPGGHLHDEEHLADAVVREVLEETGIESRFVSLVCFRHQHAYRHGKSDIYFVCRLEPLSTRISKQDDEIAECVWMPVDTYLNTDSVSIFNKEIVRAAIETPGFGPITIDGYRDPAKVEVFFPKDGTRGG